MKSCSLLMAGLLCSILAFSQKKPLDHSVYDGWQSIGERTISNDGKFVVYTITPQEGDATLVIQATDNSYKKEVPRGYGAEITEDSRFVIFKIRPFFKDTRDARIKKRTPDQMPKDSLAIAELGKDNMQKIPRVKSFKIPEKAAGWVAYLMEKPLAENGRPAMPDSATRLNNMLHVADSLARAADSIRNKVNEAQTKGMTALQGGGRREQRPPARNEDPIEEGTDLVLKNLATGEEKKYKLVSDYNFSKKGNVFLVETTRKNGDAGSKATILWVSMDNNFKTDTVMKRFNDAKSYAFDEDGKQLAFVAERDSVAKALQKFYRLWYYKPGMDSAMLRGDRNVGGIEKGFTISSDYNNNFSKDGKRLFIGLAPIRPSKDTTLVDFETARLDVWTYHDDYLQPQQLLQLNTELRRSHLAVIGEGDTKITRLADDSCETIRLADEGNSTLALGISNKGYRIAQQWGDGASRLFLVNTMNGTRKLVQERIRGFAEISPKGKFIVWYDWKLRNWISYNTATGVTINFTKDIKVPLFDEDDDHPDDPPSHGTMAWYDNDAFIYIYDKYDIWKCDPTGNTKPVCITEGIGRKTKNTFRYVMLDREEDRFLTADKPILLTVFNEKDKTHGFLMYHLNQSFVFDEKQGTLPVSFSGFLKAKNADKLAYLCGSYNKSYNVTVAKNTSLISKDDIQLSDINPQQKDYNWFTVELRNWKMFDGKMSEGLLFKPENFDSTKKYPIIFYFYERDADTRYNYRPPAPSASTINIAYFTSNGYLVFDPDIFYKNGEPGESAYNSVVSAANYLKKFKWVDSSKMAIQGQSWGGYQVAYLVTRTNMFAAAGAGAPVSNMTSAYSGIRWGAGISREFQYEKGQSRIGYTPWQRIDLYLKNSPLFKADKVTTPLLITHNDADGAVPWYQGIEYFSALKRLGKKAWLLEYNGEDHNLVERRNRKDLSVRLGQFFDYYLKGAKAPRWMTDGVPATLKGVDWGITEEPKRGF